MNSSFNVVDLFCGAGGLSYGFQSAGFNIVFAADNDAKSVETYRKNVGDHAHVIDIFDQSGVSIQSAIGKAIKVDVIVGGPPCQGFSIQRRGSDLDQRNDLVIEFGRIVKELKPQLFLMENVSGLLSKRGAFVLGKLKDVLGEVGYEFHLKKLDASHFGVPQARKRVFLVGVDRSQSVTPFTFPEEDIRFVSRPKTVRDTISDLVSVESSEVLNHRADNLSDINLARIRSITAGQGRDALPSHLQLPCHRSNSSHRHLDTYGRMPWDGLAPTITARFDSFSRGRFGHPTLDRTITLREGARLQTFPDHFEFIGTKVEVARQIGNAVPPLLAQKIAEEIANCLQGKTLETRSECVA